jgi:tetratricopeptide (TPR) repeat protein
MPNLTRTRLGAAVILGFIPLAAIAQPWVESERAAGLMGEDLAGAAEIYGRLAQANPSDGSAWSQYGYCLHGSKQYEKALAAYARAIELGYQPATQLYNSACAHALMGHTDEALPWLERALNARFADQRTLETDTDMDSLRADPRFAALTGITRGLAKPPAATREDGWAWDLDFFIRRMEQMHWDLYGKAPKEALRAEVQSLKRDIPRLTDSQARARLRRITAMVGDGHTASRLTAEGEARPLLPLHLFTFTDGTYIIGAGAPHEGLAGAMVLEVGGLKIDDALAATRPYLSVDNEMGYLAGGPTILMSPAILQAIGAAPDQSSAKGGFALKIQKPGHDPEEVRVEPADFPAGGHGGLLTPGFTYVHDSFDASRPLFLRSPDQALRIESLPESKAVYFWFGGVTDTPAGTLAEFTHRAFDQVEATGAEHLIIDMRFNGGGNTGLVRPLVDAVIRSDTINRRGHLWVIIGRHTFSAAQNTVNLLDKQTRAVFVGEPTGSRPQFVGESTFFILPHSRTRVSCSSRYWQHMDSTDQRTWVQPDIAAPMSFADYAAGRDPALDAILRWIAPGAAEGE